MHMGRWYQWNHLQIPDHVLGKYSRLLNRILLDKTLLRHSVPRWRINIEGDTNWARRWEDKAYLSRRVFAWRFPHICDFPGRQACRCSGGSTWEYHLHLAVLIWRACRFLPMCESWHWPLLTARTKSKIHLGWNGPDMLVQKRSEGMGN